MERETINSIDQSWQSKAQVLTLRAEAEGLLDGKGATTATDEEVKKSLKQRGISNQVFMLAETIMVQFAFESVRMLGAVSARPKYLVLYVPILPNANVLQSLNACFGASAT